MSNCSVCDILVAKIDVLQNTVGTLVKLINETLEYHNRSIVNKTLSISSAIEAEIEKTIAFSPQPPRIELHDTNYKHSNIALLSTTILEKISESSEPTSVDGSEHSDSLSVFSVAEQADGDRGKQTVVGNICQSDPGDCVCAPDSDKQVSISTAVTVSTSNSFCVEFNSIIEHAIPTSIFVPYYYFSVPLDIFSAETLVSETTFTHTLNNRTVAYFGDVGYKYGSIVHPPQKVNSDTNPYLTSILRSIKAVTPFFTFNSVMVQAYEGREAHIPLHSDDEDCINPDSHILTLSLGEERNIRFISGKHIDISCKLVHGSIITMSAKSQQVFKHEIPKNQGDGLRVSLTLRLLKSPDSDNHSSQVSCDAATQTQEQNHDPFVVDFLMDVGSHISDNAMDTAVQPKKHLNSPHHQHNNSREPVTTPKVSDVLYISSSMFRRLDGKLLSSTSQQAHVFSFRGKDAAEMHTCLTKSTDLTSINESNVSKIFLLCGTNNIEDIYYDKQSIEKCQDDIDNIVGYLYNKFPNATINIINLFPRDIRGQTHIINEVNNFIQHICSKNQRLFYIDTETNFLFSDGKGNRRRNFFYDKVHLNDVGVKRLAKHIKFLSHNDLHTIN